MTARRSRTSTSLTSSRNTCLRHVLTSTSPRRSPSCPRLGVSAPLSPSSSRFAFTDAGERAYTEGMDLNPLFTGSTSFRPAGEAGGELKLFEQAGVRLAHGWLVDPSSPEYAVVARMQDYDTAVNLLVEADYLTKGHFVVAEPEYEPVPGPSSAGPSSSSSAGPSRSGSSSARAGPSIPRTYDLTLEQQQKVEDGGRGLLLYCPKA